MAKSRMYAYLMIFIMVTAMLLYFSYTFLTVNLQLSPLCFMLFMVIYAVAIYFLIMEIQEVLLQNIGSSFAIHCNTCQQILTYDDSKYRQDTLFMYCSKCKSRIRLTFVSTASEIKNESGGDS
ncbi:MAG: hypothetical protein K9N06_04385 [Candidatus Cloacimonetes bacterium]|nr:hypothetical protein [Candidatus Cloacimonadota bacterium]